jgi:DNA-binding YbaB/EbfC family protein
MESGSGGPDFAAMVQRARELQGDLAHATEDLRVIEATGHSMNGTVSATVSGEGLLVDLRIDPAVIDPDDPLGLADLVTDAVNAANRALGERRKERLSGFAGGMDSLLGALRPRQDR